MHPDHISQHMPPLHELDPRQRLAKDAVIVKVGEVIGSGHYVCWVEWANGDSETLVGAHEDIRSTSKVFERIGEFTADIAFEHPVLIARVGR